MNNPKNLDRSPCLAQIETVRAENGWDKGRHFGGFLLLHTAPGEADGDPSGVATES
jgi:hypothetical protein